MTIKVTCPCGTRFQFEVEPVNGRMPVRINCPTCNADDTELANALIQQQLQAAATPAPAPIPAPPPPSGLRVAGLHRTAPQAAPAPVAAVPAAVAEAVAEFCPKHKTETATDACKVCGKPICLKCMELFGYVCSVYCRQQAEIKRIYIPACPHQKTVVAGRAAATTRWITSTVAVLVVLVLGLWFYYAWFARDPKVVYSVTFPKEDLDHPSPPEYYKLVGPGELFSVKAKQASLFDVAQQRTVWSVSLRADDGAAKTSANKSKAGAIPDDLDDFGYWNPVVAMTTNDLWLSLGDRLVRLDRRTGTKTETPIRGRIMNVSSDDDALLLVSVNRDLVHSISKVSLSDGSVQAEDLDGYYSKRAQKKAVNTTASSQSGTDGKLNKFSAAKSALKRGLKSNPQTDSSNAAASSTTPDASKDTASFLWQEQVPTLVLAGPNVIEFRSHLLEQKSVAHQAMKPKGKSVLDGKVTASQGADLAQEMMNDARRDMTGGVEIEDVSRYQVTLHRWFATNVPDWSGEVTGPPSMYSFKTVDVLVAGQSVSVFDKQNRKLWEAKMAFPIRADTGRLPCLQTADALYLADRGSLACFDLVNGNVRWRLDSVGVSSILEDDRHGIYVTTTTAGADQVLYSQQVNIHNKVYPLILKVNPKNGKVLWRLQSVGEECMMSGKFLYATREAHVMNAMNLEHGPDLHYNLSLIDRSGGGTIWDYHRVNHPVMKTDVQQNWILIQMTDQVLVLKFFSL